MGKKSVNWFHNLTVNTLVENRAPQNSAARQLLNRGHRTALVVGCFLLGAAFLKGQQLLTWPLLGDGLMNNRWLLLGAVEVELFLGCWLLSGIKAHLARLVAIALFLVFLGFSVARGISGEVSCGCLGAVPVNPWVMVLLDLAVIFGLLSWKPSEVERRTRRVWRGGLTLAAVVLLTPLAWGVTHVRAVTLDGSTADIGDRQLIVLAPEGWVGKPFPLSRHLGLSADVTVGQWEVVLYHLDCPRCQELISRLELVARLVPEGRRRRIALIQVSPDGPATGETDSGCHHGCLDPSRRWFVETPLRVQLRNGVVVEVAR